MTSCVVVLGGCSVSRQAGIAVPSRSTATAMTSAAAPASTPAPDVVTTPDISASSAAAPASTPAAVVVNSVTGWVHVDDGAAVFIGWTVSGTTVTGTYSSAILSNGTIKTENDGYTGVIDGGAVTLTFTAAFGGTTISGQVGDNALTLSFPRSDGTLAPVTFAPGAATDYNTAVTALQQSAAGIAAASQESASQAAVVAQSQADIASARAAVDTAAKHLADAIGPIADDAKVVNAAITAVNTDLSKQRAALQKVQKEAAVVVATAKTAGPGNSDNCYAASTVTYDASDVDYQGNAIGGDLSTYAPSSLQTDLNDLDAAQQALLSAQSAAPDYSTTTGVPTAAEITTAKADGSKALSAWSTITTTAPATATDLTKQATDVAGSASKKAGC